MRMPSAIMEGILYIYIFSPSLSVLRRLARLSPKKQLVRAPEAVALAQVIYCASEKHLRGGVSKSPGNIVVEIT